MILTKVYFFTVNHYHFFSLVYLLLLFFYNIIKLTKFN